jgi:hypothetical protein
MSRHGALPLVFARSPRALGRGDALFTPRLAAR